MKCCGSIDYYKVAPCVGGLASGPVLEQRYNQVLTIKLFSCLKTYTVVPKTVLGLVVDTATNTTELSILDAQSVAAGPVARVQIPHRIPPGFHGNWIPDLPGED